MAGPSWKTQCAAVTTWRGSMIEPLQTPHPFSTLMVILVTHGASTAEATVVPPTMIGRGVVACAGAAQSVTATITHNPARSFIGRQAI
jgi:hypothetical protein